MVKTLEKIKAETQEQPDTQDDFFKPVRTTTVVNRAVKNKSNSRKIAFANMQVRRNTTKKKCSRRRKNK